MLYAFSWKLAYFQVFALYCLLLSSSYSQAERVKDISIVMGKNIIAKLYI